MFGSAYFYNVQWDTPASPLTSYGTMGELFNGSVPHFPPSRNGDNNCCQLRGLAALPELLYIKDLEWNAAYSSAQYMWLPCLRLCLEHPTYLWGSVE